MDLREQSQVHTLGYPVILRRVVHGQAARCTLQERLEVVSSDLATVVWKA